MKIKSFERPILELSESLVYKKAKLIDDQYKLSINDLTAADKLAFVSQFLKLNHNIDTFIQEYLDEACRDRMYAESEPFGDWDE